MLTRLHGVSDIVSPEITALSELWRHNTAALPTAAALMLPLWKASFANRHSAFTYLSSEDHYCVTQA